MMEELKQKEVIVYGYWGNTNSATVRNALKLKRVPYEYVEEDMDNLSRTALELNPVLKTIPVLIVDGRP
ncbi:Glutathione S-transferase U10 [Apostasia shenzhenica]|uniref:Glutathione S-transferase U10 n=1 Tax=Apostasia shenzhenica TaxID=1088818 RepID=A0A2I0BFS6_9ASPA|nr:Glutathione S-transferase U10 [Apostasia shenzhenica]